MFPSPSLSLWDWDRLLWFLYYAYSFTTFFFFFLEQRLLVLNLRLLITQPCTIWTVITKTNLGDIHYLVSSILCPYLCYYGNIEPLLFHDYKCTFRTMSHNNLEWRFQLFVGVRIWPLPKITTCVPRLPSHQECLKWTTNSSYQLAHIQLRGESSGLTLSSHSTPRIGPQALSCAHIRPWGEDPGLFFPRHPLLPDLFPASTIKALRGDSRFHWTQLSSGFPESWR